MKLQKRILLIFLILILAFTVKCFAVSAGDTISYDGIVTTMPETEVMNDENILEDAKYDELASTPMLMSIDDDDTISISSIISKFETSGDAAVGIDVSYYQGTIDWAKVSNAGVKFVMIRCGYRGYGSNGTLVEDSTFKTNIQGAINNGIYVGIYFYSTALTDAEALEEAAFVVNLIKKYDIKYPVAYDFEDFSEKYSSSGNPYRTNGLSTSQINSSARVFLSYIKSKGYTACLYGSSNYLNNTWASDIKSAYSVWVAHYNVSKPTYTGSYKMWQYTSSGTVSGINANVDVDIDYSYYMSLNKTDITDSLFNATYYADRYSDLKAAFGYDSSKLKEHWLNYGIKEGRSASPVFDPKYYLNKYSDLKKAFGTNYKSAYEHFINYGIHEGRQASKYFNVTYYVSNNADVKKAFYSSNSYSLVHFASYGISEGRQGSSDFSVKTYYSSQSSYTKKQLGTKYIKYYALAAGGSPINDPTIDITDYLFDATYYANKYSDLKKAFGYSESKLKAHWLVFGIREGRSASPVFDPVYYINKYSDLKKAFGTNYKSAYDHFIKYGIHEGRQASSTFNVKTYIKNYSDLQAEFGTNYSKALGHYMIFGRNEGRKAV